MKSGGDGDGNGSVDGVGVRKGGVGKRLLYGANNAINKDNNR